MFLLCVQTQRDTVTVGNKTGVFMRGVKRMSPNVFLMAESLRWWKRVWPARGRQVLTFQREPTKA